MGWRTKSIAQVQSEFDRGELKRTLGPIHLVLFGIGCIIGAGIFVRTGTAAALYAGPAVILSFVIAGVVCALAGLCYVGSSRVDLQACKLEYSIVSPK